VAVEAALGAALGADMISETWWCNQLKNEKDLMSIEQNDEEKCKSEKRKAKATLKICFCRRDKPQFILRSIGA
jgi:hypothetical protein